MICRYCGSEISDNCKVCNFCGMDNDEYVGISSGSKFASCLLPLVGLCMFIMLKIKGNPESHTILMWTLCGIVLWIFLYVAAFFMGILLTFQI
ncbi:hypothetical protein [uncultured Clostridium sp.]|uniref:hypothetical protein n=1 Tax=uncultured Clostridium sp. TaxID=59620 RepID=UPI0025EBEDB7|nr:hypothetical protein [uncultured Clostridium sp.]